MGRAISELAGQLADPTMLVDIPKLITKYYSYAPNPSIPEQRVYFGTSGHRGTSLQKTFNEWHILAITQAICLYRKHMKIDGPLFLGVDTHALSMPAFVSALEVLAANDINVFIAEQEEYTPTPVVSYAILNFNKNRTSGFADGIIITPSHNPPEYGGFKYNPPTGGPASEEITTWIEKKANEFLDNHLNNVKRIAFEKALTVETTRRYDFLNHYVSALCNIINMDLIKDANIHIGVDPLGGAGTHYWSRIAEHYKINLTVVNNSIDPTFRFIPLDWDGEIRMDPASPYAMANLIKLKNQFDISFACDTDHDRHGVVTPKLGLLNPNHYLSIAVFYLFQNREQWFKKSSVGKTIVTTQMINQVATKLKRNVFEVPVGFKWFADGLYDGSLSFAGEQSAGATFSRINGEVWTTDKDGIASSLLAAEMTAFFKRDLSDIYNFLTTELGEMFYIRQDAPATLVEKKQILTISANQIKSAFLAGDKIEAILTTAPGNHEPIGGIKVITKSGWFVARPSGTEPIYEICAESYRDSNHLNQILIEAQSILNSTLNEQPGVLHGNNSK